MRRNKFTAVAHNQVTVAVVLRGHVLSTRTYHGPNGGGVVTDNHGPVSELLWRGGPSLWWDGQMPLIDLIRWAYRGTQRLDRSGNA